MELTCNGVYNAMIQPQNLAAHTEAARLSEAETSCKYQFGKDVLMDSTGPKHVVTAEGPCPWEPHMMCDAKDRVVSSPLLTPKEGVVFTIVPEGTPADVLVKNAERVFTSVLRDTRSVVPGISLQLFQNGTRFYVGAMFHFTPFHLKEAAEVWKTEPDEDLESISVLAFSERTNNILAYLSFLSTNAALQLSGQTHKFTLQTDTYTWNTVTKTPINSRWSYYTLHNLTYAPASTPGSFGMTWYGRDMGWMKVKLPVAEEEVAHPSDSTPMSNSVVFTSKDVPVIATVTKRPEVHGHSIDPMAKSVKYPLVLVRVENRGALGYPPLHLSDEDISRVLCSDPLHSQSNCGTINPLLHDPNGHVSRSAQVVSI
jgi:hypothetical protein